MTAEARKFGLEGKVLSSIKVEARYNSTALVAGRNRMLAARRLASAGLVTIIDDSNPFMLIVKLK